MKISYSEFCENLPTLHTWDEGASWNTGGFSKIEFYNLQNEVISKLPNDFIACETGAGASTIALLLLNAAKVISIAPNPELFSRITNFCKQHEINVNKLIQHDDISEKILPILFLDGESKIDLALIDGGHGWPTVFVDFCYLNSALKFDGFLIIDDIQLHSVKELARLLMMSTEYSFQGYLGPKTLFFRKKTDKTFMSDFGGQPYIIKKSNFDKAQGQELII